MGLRRDYRFKTRELRLAEERAAAGRLHACAFPDSLGECLTDRKQLVAGTNTPIPACPIHGEWKESASHRADIEAWLLDAGWVLGEALPWAKRAWLHSEHPGHYFIVWPNGAWGHYERYSTGYKVHRTMVASKPVSALVVHLGHSKSLNPGHGRSAADALPRL